LLSPVGGGVITLLVSNVSGFIVGMLSGLTVSDLLGSLHAIAVADIPMANKIFIASVYLINGINVPNSENIIAWSSH
jgi:hypothetical protein